MASINRKTTRPKVFTHEGAKAIAGLKPADQLRRSVMSCMLWEGEFYEDGVSIADRIAATAAGVPTDQLAEIAIEAREQGNLRHVPLLLLTELAKRGGAITGDTIARVIKRADEMPELLSLYWRNGKTPISKQMKRGLSEAFRKFDAYQLAKYNRDRDIKLRDVLFLTHAKPKDAEQAEVWKQLIDGTLSAPDTWEVNLSGGADKKETFTRMLAEGKLGYMALLRNLRNMEQAGVDRKLIGDAIVARKGGAHRLLPFRYLSAARAVPSFEPQLDKALTEAINEMPTLKGTTLVLVDVSGSMNWGQISAKSDLSRMDAAACLGAIVNGEDVRVFSFANSVVEVPARKGMSGVDAIIRSQSHGGTDLGGAIRKMNTIAHDRLIVITDEQSQSRVPNPVAERAYLINVASYQNGIGYRNGWTHIDGFSEAVLKYIHASEQ